jgi:hypothetical protein
MVCRILYDGYGQTLDNYDDLMAERVVLDPSFLFQDDEERVENGEIYRRSNGL